MARCLDDHPSSICFCESEVHRALFRDYFLDRHLKRMTAHGFSLEEAIGFLDRKKQDSVDDFFRWFADVWPRARRLFEKPEARVLGDKCPELSRSPELIGHLAAHCRLIYTARDPRAIYCGIEARADATPADKQESWDDLIQNYRAWRPFLDSPNLLIVRYEDLVTSRETTMTAVYSHLDLPYSPRYLEPFNRLFPRRFLSTTTADPETDIREDFDASRISSWRQSLGAEQIDRVRAEPAIRDFMERFGYED
jgi:hypothetical protein